MSGEPLLCSIGKEGDFLDRHSKDFDYGKESHRHPISANLDRTQKRPACLPLARAYVGRFRCASSLHRLPIENAGICMQEHNSSRS